MSNFLIDEETDLLAAEFVLGTLDTEERARGHALLKSDPAFIAMVRIWERRFGELHLMVEPVDPDPKLWPRIKSNVTSTPQPPAAEPPAGPKPAQAAGATGPPEAPKPLEASKPLERPAAGTPAANGDRPAGESATAATAIPAEPAPSAGLPPAPGLVLPTPEAAVSPDARALEAIIRSERTYGPPPQPPEPAKPVEKVPEVVADAGPARLRKPAVDVVRSRDRWRVFGVLMVVLVAAITGLLAAWKFIPDQLPAQLRPAQLMMSIGIDARSQPADHPTKRAPPGSAFDE